MKKELAVFEGHQIRRIYDEPTETWWFSVVDIVQVLTQSDYQASRKYWKVLKGRLKKEGSQLVTNCYQLKMPAADGKSYLTDAATAETLLRLVQSVPSPKAEPIKLWLAKVGYERMQEMADPARSPADPASRSPQICAAKTRQPLGNRHGSTAFPRGATIRGDRPQSRQYPCDQRWGIWHQTKWGMHPIHSPPVLGMESGSFSDRVIPINNFPNG